MLAAARSVSGYWAAAELDLAIKGWQPPREKEPEPGMADILETAGLIPNQFSRLRGSSGDALVDAAVKMMLTRQTAIADGTFETGEKNPQHILCSDDACPCTDEKKLVIGRTAYLYISEDVVNFRKNCRSLLERDMMMEKIYKNGLPIGDGDKWTVIIGHGIGNPFYLCETGAKLRGLVLSVALADAKVVAETGFAPLRLTPKAR